MSKTQGFSFQEQGRGRGYWPGQTACVRAVSVTDARNVARAYMAKPVGRGRCTGKETLAIVTDAARAVGRRELYPDDPALWGAARRKRKPRRRGGR